ncbi:MAG: acetyl-CoA carboxylase biotin carboxyl carrier protein [Planctomycetales bacterium]
MTDPEPESGDVFDVRNFHRLVEMMCEHDVNEMDIKRGDQRIRLRRGGYALPTAADPVLVSHPGLAPVAAPAPLADGSAAPAESDDSEFVFVLAETVGTFYVAANPESAPFVKVGDHIGPDSIVCIIEAMKVFNQIEANASGKIVAVLPANGDPVEFGQKLFKIDPRG